jgi:hypothetical protein
MYIIRAKGALAFAGRAPGTGITQSSTEVLEGIGCFRFFAVPGGGFRMSVRTVRAEFTVLIHRD